EELDSTYEDVILDDDVKTTVKCLVGISKLRVQVTSKYLSSQMQVKGAMLYGPPGTGKTHLARALAKSVGSTMLAVDCATLQSKWVGETEKLIKATFTLARKLSPCVVFIDEVDALFRRRTSSDRSWERSAITQFLQDMDGLRQNATTVAATTPFVLVATNRPMDLDDAFMRRLPQKFYIGLPSRAARAKILNLFLDKDDLDASVNIEDLARRTEGYSGSDLRSLSAQAAL
ncbi:AAA ATPase, partial [Thozetella sp. PMI_491]